MNYSIRLTLGALLLTGLFISLGQWQLHRADVKRDMLTTFETQQQVQPLTWDTTMLIPKAYQRIALQGQYAPSYFLLDNQYANHQWGYHVLSPLKLVDGTIIIVDRGWVAGELTRQHFPEITTPQTLQTITGHVYYPRHNRLIGHVPFTALSQGAWLIAEFDKKGLAKMLHAPVLPFIIRLDSRAPDGFYRQWEIVTLPPMRHMGYAFQWFALALTTLVGWFFLLRKRRHA